MSKIKNLLWHNHTIKQEHRQIKYNHAPLIIWFTGLSGSGKSTLANALEDKLFANDFKTYLLDGDNIRFGLNQDLGFSNSDRVENIRRIAEVSRLFYDAGLITICSFISPFESERKFARSLVGENDFIEVYVSTDIKVCEQRDVKGLYKKARDGEIKNFTGIDSSYEEPLSPELVIDTAKNSIEFCASVIYNHIVNRLQNKTI